MLQRILNQLKAIRLNTRTAIFFGCLSLSFIFWLLTSLSRTFNEVVLLPVVYENLPKEKVLASDLPSSLEIEVSATGFDILWFRLAGPNGSVRLNAETNQLKRLPSADAGYYAMIMEQRKTLVKSHLGENLDFVKINPDTIFFDFKPRKEATLGVRFNGLMEFENQYGLVDEVRFNPSTITVSGPSTVVDTIDYARTFYQEFSGLNESLSVEVTLDSTLYPNVTFSPSTVLLEAVIEKFTEGTVEVPVKLPAGLSGSGLKLFPDKVNVSFLVPLSQYDLIKPEMFSVYASEADFNPNSSTNLQLNVVKYPATVSRIKAQPDRVEFIIKK